MPKETTAVIRPAASGGTPKSRCSAIAAPTNSARSVAMATISACAQSPQRTGVGKCSRHSSARFLPVAMPILADRYWTSIAMRLAMTMTQTRRKPYLAPPLMFVAKLPGST